jgi:hypothetical protein
MNKIRFLAAAALAASSLFSTVYADEIIVREGPPPVRYEVVPPARIGYTWAPGYWDWRDGRWDWVGGHYVTERRGYIYSPPIWVQENGHWIRREERWARHDDDHDGVPNGEDSHPENPYRQ